MAKILFRAVVVLMLFAVPALATEKFANENELMTWVTHYYQHPEPKVVEKAVKDAQELKVLQNTRYQPVMAGFFAGLFQTNKDLRQPIADLNASFPQVDRHAILRGLFLSSKKDGEPAPLVAEPLAKNPDKNPAKISPITIYNLWGYFYATGDEVAVKRVIETLPWSTLKEEEIKKIQNDKERAEKTLQWQVGVTAKRTLIDHASRYPDVMAICKKELPNQPPEVKAILQEVISQAEAGSVR